MSDGRATLEFVVHRFDSLGSTNDEGMRMASEGAPEGTVIVAAQQTAGRGRLGRRWASSPGEGLYLSLILKPAVPFDQLWQLSFVISLATAEAVSRAAGLPASVKWPNDVLLQGRKISGILLEARRAKSGSPDERSAVVVAGIGINVNTESFPPDLIQKATSIMLETGRRTDLSEVERALLESVRERYIEYANGGFGRIMQRWKAIDATVGRRITASTPNGIVEGTAIAVDGEGDLIVKPDAGDAIRISAGEVLLRNEA